MSGVRSVSSERSIGATTPFPPPPIFNKVEEEEAEEKAVATFVPVVVVAVASDSILLPGAPGGNVNDDANESTGTIVVLETVSEEFVSVSLLP